MRKKYWIIGVVVIVVLVLLTLLFKCYVDEVSKVSAVQPPYYEINETIEHPDTRPNDGKDTSYIEVEKVVYEYDGDIDGNDMDDDNEYTPADYKTTCYSDGVEIDCKACESFESPVNIENELINEAMVNANELNRENGIESQDEYEANQDFRHEYYGIEEPELIDTDPYADN